MSNAITQAQYYKGFPMIKSGGILCVGDPADGAVLILTTLTTTQLMGEEIPELIFLQIQNTDKNSSDCGTIIKQTDKTGLYNALDIGLIWLSRELKK
ncbi:MAG TPA: hypothetical protein DER23_04950 [Clostridiales bacterium]|jgi:hypothetical protein|nr:hypothetical protein [Clostridiales bacterium]HCG35675.1 hypothetical protein [Clostridiales bacterium]